MSRDSVSRREHVIGLAGGVLLATARVRGLGVLAKVRRVAVRRVVWLAVQLQH